VPNVSPIASPTAGTEPSHTVVPGDTLWGLAATVEPQASPAQITALWQQWYAANRTTIGLDPGLLLPGQLLVLPGATS
jgi:nucleoid-associated protein YgaU